MLQPESFSYLKYKSKTLVLNSLNVSPYMELFGENFLIYFLVHYLSVCIVSFMDSLEL